MIANITVLVMTNRRKVGEVGMIREYIIKISDEIMEEEIADRPKELVRCKDCRFRILHQCNCEKKENVTYGMFTEDDFFCANGERRTEV